MSRLKGSKELEARLKAIPGEVLQSVRPALVKGAQEIADAMETLVPEDQGDLLNSITVTGPGETTPAYSSDGGKRTAALNRALVTVGSPDVRHGHLQEFGTEHHEAQPFMRPAFRLKRDRVQRRITRAIGKALKGQSDV